MKNGTFDTHKSEMGRKIPLPFSDLTFYKHLLIFTIFPPLSSWFGIAFVGINKNFYKKIVSKNP